MAGSQACPPALHEQHRAARQYVAPRVAARARPLAPTACPAPPARASPCPARPLFARARRVAVLLEISTLLETGLDQETLAILLALCEQGVNPEALAAVVKELRREGAALRAATEGAQDSNAEPPVLA